MGKKEEKGQPFRDTDLAKAMPEKPVGVDVTLTDGRVIRVRRLGLRSLPRIMGAMVRIGLAVHNGVPIEYALANLGDDVVPLLEAAIGDQVEDIDEIDLMGDGPDIVAAFWQANYTEDALGKWTRLVPVISGAAPGQTQSSKGK